ncbi:dihydrofolate reductase family protein [uncultured Thomasclavelia sp.]|uniref:dihydrofolate reductase family protein n=1 Tax=uncultured Thomasclavelia sp. TaxID=3025759 RepID=UPI0025DE3735|nr:dihydrofolate reductase family protein [uncultured Thomasclavelia sp.]
MKKIILYIAMSLDGYIADHNGQVDWLQGQDDQVTMIDTYSPFIKNIDTIIMGYKTYHQIITQLAPDNWVYQQQTSYVITHRQLSSTDNIIFTSKSPSQIVFELKKQPGKDIWIYGGANIINQLMKDNLIDEYYITIIPTILGSGIRLFESIFNEIRLKLIHQQTYNGIIELIYTRC